MPYRLTFQPYYFILPWCVAAYLSRNLIRIQLGGYRQIALLPSPLFPSHALSHFSIHTYRGKRSAHLSSRKFTLDDCLHICMHNLHKSAARLRLLWHVQLPQLNWTSVDARRSCQTPGTRECASRARVNKPQNRLPGLDRQVSLSFR